MESSTAVYINNWQSSERGPKLFTWPKTDPNSKPDPTLTLTDTELHLNLALNNLGLPIEGLPYDMSAS